MFQPENDIERALVRACEEPGARVAFLKAFLDAELAFALVDSGNAREGYVVPEVSDERGAFVPVFTAESRVKAMFGEETLMVVRQSFRQIVGQIEDASFVLNPGSDYGREFTAEDVAALLKGDFERAAEGFEPDEDDEDDAPPAMVGRATPAPTHLTRPLAALFAGMPEVSAAHVAQAVFADKNGVKRLVIGVSAAGDLDAVFERVADVLGDVAKPTDVIDFVSVPGSPLDGYFERDADPFYRKGG